MISHYKSSYRVAASIGLFVAVLFCTSIAVGEETIGAVASENAVNQPVTEVAVESAAPTVAEVSYALDNMMLLICAVLVLFMQAGFAMLEIGLNAAKNTVNILAKNIMDLAVGVVLFFVVGYGLMYPGEEYAGEWFGWGGRGVSVEAPVAEAGQLHPQVDFLFQVAFAATAATIVSGAVAGRMRFTGYMIYSAILTALVYPVSGMWKWGGGWLDALGFHDFAGSILVHAVGGFAGLAGAIVLGPRIGRFVNGKARPMPGHNLGFAALGVLILWVGWYGFNPGSQLAFVGAANTNATVLIAVNTTLAAATGAIIAMTCSWFFFSKPDLSMAMNGALAGLVGITASCDMVSNHSAAAIGSIAGVLVVLATILLEKLRIDDPVGAWPVHGVCGLWGGIACGIFGTATLSTQILGSLVIAAWSFSTMLVLFLVLKSVDLLRVSECEEQIGLDITEHGASAYPATAVAAARTSSEHEPAPEEADFESAPTIGA